MTIEATSDTVLSLFVPGRARTKGSMKVITPRGKKPIMVEDHSLSKPWRDAIRKAAWAAHPNLRTPWHEACADPVIVTLVFRFEQPVTGQAADLDWPVLGQGVNASGDLDKLVRNVLDALQDAHVIADDRLVVGLSTIKRWCYDAKPGVDIEVVRA